MPRKTSIAVSIVFCLIAVSASAEPATLSADGALRDGPGDAFDTIGIIKAGTEVDLQFCGKTGTWCGIVHDGQSGFILSAHLKAEAPAIRPDLPPVFRVGDPAFFAFYSWNSQLAERLRRRTISVSQARQFGLDDLGINRRAPVRPRRERMQGLRDDPGARPADRVQRNLDNRRELATGGRTAVEANRAAAARQADRSRTINRPLVIERPPATSTLPSGSGSFLSRSVRGR